jgi:CubicO group peptidase (beta-lactamase class C family)
MAYEPGEGWTYNSGASHLLSAIVTEATGTPLRDYAMDNLLTPLGIESSDVSWPQDRQGYYWGSGGAGMVPLDMLKFGYLYLNNGTWDGEQIVPSEWVQRSSETLFDFNDYSGYSYQWWTYPTDIVNVLAAVGYQGQFIFVIPELDMVVVFTSSVPPSEVGQHPAMLFDYIVKAAIGEFSQNLNHHSTVALVTLAVTPIPILIAGLYYRIRIRKWTDNSDMQEAV